MKTTPQKRGWMYSITVFILFTSILLTGVYLLNATNTVTDDDGDTRLLGEYTTAMAATSAEMQEALLYLDQAAKYAIPKAARAHRNGGTYTKVIEGGTTKTSACGKSVYPKWSTEQRFCPPPLGINGFTKHATSQLWRFLQRAPYPIPKQYEIDVNPKTTRIHGYTDEPISLSIDDTYTPENPGKLSYSSIKEEQPVQLADTLNWPVKPQTISSCYGPRGDGKHDGVDFVGKPGEGIYPVANGTVIDVCPPQGKTLKNTECYGLGKHVVIKHTVKQGDNLYSKYSHLKSTKVQEGETVQTNQRIGVMGNTGHSTGRHLDLKLYSTKNRGVDEGEHPFCFYNNKQLAKLDVINERTNCETTNFNRAYFYNKCDNIANLKERVLAVTKDDRSNMFGAATTTSKQSEQIGTYNVTPAFIVNASEGIPGTAKRHQKIIDWAKKTWNNCQSQKKNINPQQCMQQRVKQYNKESNKYTISLLSQSRFQCTQTPFYTHLIDTYETCLNNGLSDCTCSLQLKDISDTKTYRIKLHNQHITMQQPRQRSHDLNTTVTNTSLLPAKQPNHVTTTYLRKEGQQLSLSKPNWFTDMNQLTLYKPDADSVRLVKQSGNKPRCQPMNNQPRTTYHVCARSNKRITTWNDNGKRVTRKEELTFSMELPNNKPEIDKDDITTQQVEQSHTSTVKKATQAISKAGIVLPQVQKVAQVANIVLDVVKKKQGAAIQVKVDVPQADIEGFKISCSTTPGETKPTRFVNINNPSTPDDVNEVSLTRFTKRSKCDYITLPNAKGAMQYLREIEAYTTQGKQAFMTASCGTSGIQQLANAPSSYCLTLTPVDSEGNAGEPVTTCETFPSLKQRVLEQLPGVQQLKDNYLQLQDKITRITSAMQSPTCNGIASLVTQKTTSDTTSICKYMRERTLERLRQAGKTAWTQTLTTADKIQHLTRFAQTYPRFSRVMRSNVCTTLPSQARKGLLQDILRTTGQLGGEANKRIEQRFLNHVNELSYPEQQRVLKQSMRANDAIKSYVSEKKNTNKNFNAMAASDKTVQQRHLNKLGLTRSQTPHAIRYALNGKLGKQARGVMAEHMLPYLSANTVTSTCESLLSLTDDTLSTTVTRHLRTLPKKLQERVWDDTIQQLPQRRLQQFTPALSTDVQQRLVTYYTNNLKQQFTESITNVKQQLTQPLRCPPNPFAEQKNS